jgi:site-specific DNA-methyltransferase (adenine-specific)
MPELPDRSVHLMVTSPPYNVGKVYDEDLTLNDYSGLLYRVLQETFRVLVTGGRACVNIANLGRKPYIPLHSIIIEQASRAGFFMRGEIIWDKGAGAGASTAWGSWMSPANPTLRDTHEYILVFQKPPFGRKRPEDGESTISREEFLEFTKSVWEFGPESAKRAGHPAPFPVELPYRLIQLYTYAGEVVLDPFMGSGATALAAIKSNRTFVGYEISQEYISIAEKRIAASREGLKFSPPPAGRA